MARTLLGVALGLAGAAVLVWQTYLWLRLGLWFQEPVLLGLQQLGIAPYPSDCGGWLGLCEFANAIPLSLALLLASFLAFGARALTARPGRKA